MSPELSTVSQSFIMELAQYAIAILVPVLAGLAVQLALQAVAWVKTRLSSDQLAAVNLVVEMVVKAAEQSGLSGQIQNEAAVKKDYALSELQRILNERGLTGIDVQTLAVLIEAKVREGVHKDFAAVELEAISL